MVGKSGCAVQPVPQLELSCATLHAVVKAVCLQAPDGWQDTDRRTIRAQTPAQPDRRLTCVVDIPILPSIASPDRLAFSSSAAAMPQCMRTIQDLSN